MIHTITIPGYRPPYLNEYIGKHWSVGHKLKKKCKEAVWMCSRNTERASGKRRVDVHIVLGPKKKKADPDAIWKALLDALVQNGLLIDDNNDYCELGKVTYSRGEPGTRITLTELPCN